MNKIKGFAILILLFLFKNLNGQIITTYAGNGYDGWGNTGNTQYSGDGGPALQAQINPLFLGVDSKNNIYISQGSAFFTVRKIDAVTGILTTVAGNGTAGFSGDGGPATKAQLYEPRGIAFDSHDNLYIADFWNNCIRRVDAATGIITTVAGAGGKLNGYTGNGGPAKKALLFQPFSIAFDKNDNLYFSELGNNCIRRIDAKTGVISKVSGADPPGQPGFSGDGGPAINAKLNAPVSLAVNKQGDIIFAELDNYRIRKISAKTGIITTLAGNGEVGFNGDGGPAVKAQVYAPFWVSLDNSGNIYVCAGVNGNLCYRVRKINASTGIITTVAGNGINGSGGDGGSPLNASMWPVCTVFDKDDNMFIGDETGFKVREVRSTPLSIPQITFEGTCAQSATNFQIKAPYAVDSVAWVFNNNGSMSNEISPKFTYFFPGTFTVYAKVFSGDQSVQTSEPIEITDCSGSYSISADPDILIPNAFTPNGDGINDQFNTIFKTNPVSYNISVYNRFGQVVFVSKSPLQSWKGDYGSQPCPNGVYYYVLKYGDTSGATKIRSGSICLLR